ncbi:phosphopantetheine-binding protein [Luteimonas mephitis]|uniref:phosphopantetheine-binding protein n=1 Tax=Luteimonas mephitis TaxID=83615 RepID=UPI003A93F2B8
MHKQAIKRFILDNFLFTDNVAAIADDASLIRSGVVDSMGILELIEYLEKTFRIHVTPEEMVPANFDSIDTINTFLACKTAA